MTTSAAPVVKPTEPNSLSVSGIQATSVRLTWTASSAVGTSPVTGYVLALNGERCRCDVCEVPRASGPLWHAGGLDVAADGLDPRVHLTMAVDAEGH